MITNHYYPNPGDENLYAYFIWWPLDPYLSHWYPANTWLPDKWEMKLIAEIFWSVIVPLICYAVILWGCRLRRGRKA